MLADRGFVAVAMDYRLYFKHPAKVSLLTAYHLFDTAITWAVEDCAEAVAFLWNNAKQLNLDPTKMVLTGSSAGAITVLQTDYSRANALPVVEKLPKEFVPAAVIAYAGGIFCKNSQLEYATPPAPTFLNHGTIDKIVNYRRMPGSLSMSLFGSSRLARHFDRKDYNYRIVRYEDRGHEVAAALPSTIDDFCAFVDAVFAGKVIQYDATCTDTFIQKTKWSDMDLFDLYFHK
jgi:predicted esterase